VFILRGISGFSPLGMGLANRHEYRRKSGEMGIKLWIDDSRETIKPESEGGKGDRLEGEGIA